MRAQNQQSHFMFLTGVLCEEPSAFRKFVEFFNQSVVVQKDRTTFRIAGWITGLRGVLAVAGLINCVVPERAERLEAGVDLLFQIPRSLWSLIGIFLGH